MENVRRFAVCASVTLSVAACLTLVGAQEALVPGPEHKRLGYFVGGWISSGEIKENPMGMSTGKFVARTAASGSRASFPSCAGPREMDPPARPRASGS